MKRSPARLVVALSIAAALAIFIVYAAIVGGTLSLRPSQLAGHRGEVFLVGRVIGKPSGNADAAGLRFTVRDVKGQATVSVLYHGSVPDAFRSGRDIVVKGRLRKGLFVAAPGTMLTRCPSKYSAAS